MAIDRKDFEEFTVRDGLHVAINVKDFKAVVIHADTMKTSITARYTRPCRPLQLAYVSEDGIDAEFTLMTRGEVDEADNDEDASRPVSQLSARPAARRVAAPEPAANPAASTAVSAARNKMPPPSSRPATSAARPELMSSAASRAALADIHDSLFVPADDDRQWDEQVYDEADDQDILGWNSNIEPVCAWSVEFVIVAS